MSKMTTLDTAPDETSRATSDVDPGSAVVPSAQLAELLKSFQEVIRREEPLNSVRQLITHGASAMIKDGIYAALRQAIAEEMSLSANRDIFMVGSAKLGFSIKPKRRFQAFNEHSDVDIAVVAPRLYEDLWLEARRLDRARVLWTRDDRNHLKNDHLNGVIKPYLLPSESKLRWKLFDLCSRLQREGRSPYKVTVAVWHDMDALEDYQAVAVRECKEGLGVEDHGHE